MTDDCPSTSMTDDWPSTSMTDDRSSISMTDDRPSTSMTDDQPSASMIDDRQSEKEKLNKEDTTKENKIVIADDDSTIADWSDPATKLLLASYFERKSKFRDPTKRKKDLWREITDVFNKQGYIISSNALGKKFRNLKTRYSTIKRNNDKKSTGKGRIMWKWYKDMEEIFHEDKSINFDKAITSMDQEDSNAVNNVTDESEILDLSTVNRRFISAALLFYFSKNCLTALYLSLLSDMSCSFDWFSDSKETTEELRKEADDPSNADVTLKDFPSESSFDVRNENSFDTSSLDGSSRSNSSSRKAAKSKQLYSQRSRQLEIETMKIDVLKAIENKIQQSSAIQQQNMQMWQEGVNAIAVSQQNLADAVNARTQALKELTEIIKNANVTK
ncbi:uncharacterized protein LOC109862499 isoform X3 [Pseudomyrmex gracilis]|nr:uncharacterized protein LOC109862499 isoform X3 [Pseudomyrmex gracilis]